MKRSRRFLALCALLALLVGCVSPNATTAVFPSAEPTQAAASPIPRPDVKTEPLVQIDAGETGSLAKFGVELLKANREEGKNALLSPLSVGLALGMTVNGAQGDTLAELESALGLPLDEWNAQCAAMLKDYGELGGSSETNLVNSLWCDDSFTLRDEFTARCMDIYAAQLFERDLQDPATAQAVNDWVKEATHGLIPSVVDRFPDAAVLALVNAIYFKNAFKYPFVAPIEGMEWTMDFFQADGERREPQGMSNGIREESYISYGDGQGVVLPYDDGRLGLLLMLPNEGVTLTDYLASWDGATLQALLDAQRTAEVYLTMPKFKAEWSGDLVSSLQTMGLTAPFDPDRADLSAMGSNAAGDPLYIGQILHKTAFEVNEKGTEAAAVTVEMLYSGSAMIPEPEPYIELRLERPFVYAIVDLQTAAPLFLGTVETLENM